MLWLYSNKIIIVIIGSESREREREPAKAKEKDMWMSNGEKSESYASFSYLCMCRTIQKWNIQDYRVNVDVFGVDKSGNRISLRFVASGEKDKVWVVFCLGNPPSKSFHIIFCHMLAQNYSPTSYSLLSVVYMFSAFLASCIALWAG